MGDGILIQQQRRRAPGHHGCGDDHVGLCSLFGIDSVGQLGFLFRHGARVPIFRLLLHGYLHEGATERFHLVIDLWPHICGVDICPHRAGCADGGKPRHPHTDDVDPRRRDLPCSGHLATKRAPESLCRFYHCPVPGKVRHGGACIDRLSPGDARHRIHGDGCKATGRQVLDEIRMDARIEPRYQHGIFAHQIQLPILRWIKGYDDV